MSAAGTAIYAQLTGDSTVFGLVGNRVFPSRSPQAYSGSYPQVVYELTGGERTRSYATANPQVKRTGSIHCIAATYPAAVALAAAVRAALDHHTRATWGGVNVQGCFIEDAVESTDQDTSQGDERSYAEHELEITLWYED